MRILIVCLGNICRSPMAQGILESAAQKAGLDWHIDSAGTGSWHVGERPDRRAIAVCDRFGIDISDQRARQFTPADFDRYDLILTMDDENYHTVTRMVRNDAHRNKVRPVMSFSELENGIVPDPYYDGSFEKVYRILDDVCQRIVDTLHQPLKKIPN